MDPVHVIAEASSHEVHYQLWTLLKQYDALMERACPEDEYDTERMESVQSDAAVWLPQITLLGAMLGYSRGTIEEVCELIEDWHHHQMYQSRRMDMKRSEEYHILVRWLHASILDRTFETLPLPRLQQARDPEMSLDVSALHHRLLLIWQQVREAYEQQQMVAPDDPPIDQETGWRLSSPIQLLCHILYP